MAPCSSLRASTRNALKDYSELISKTIKNIIYNRFPQNSTDRKREIELLRSIVDENQEHLNKDWRTGRSIYQAKRLLKGISRNLSGKPTRYILSTLMKSGTKHIEACFTSNYDLERFTPSFDFSSSFQSPDIIKPVFYLESDFMLGESFLSYHLYPGQQLLLDGSRFGIPIFVMLRNPAQAIVSQYYYCLKHRFNSKSTLTPGEYFGPKKITSTEDIKKHLVTYTLPRSIKFVSAWMHAWSIQRKFENLNISIFHHEELVKKKEDFYRNMNDFLEIKSKPGEEVDIDSINQLKNHNMRRGSTNEWHDFFSREQKDSYKLQVQTLINKFPFLYELWDFDQ